MERFSDEATARNYLEKLRWPNGAACPKCGCAEIYKLTPKPDSKRPCRKGLYACKYCRKQFTVTVGTIMEDSHIPLNKWLVGIFLMCSSKKGISAHQLHRMLKMTYRSAWFMCHRIRYAMSDQSMREKMFGVIEVDETYVGGKVRKGSYLREEEATGKRPAWSKYKMPVVTLVQRDGKARSFHMKRVTENNIREILKQHVDENSAIVTDEAKVYEKLSEDFASHESVNHGAGEYSRRGNVTTNTVEGYFSLLKRGIIGSFHHVSEKHLHRYLSEFDFRYNARKLNDGSRTELAVLGIEGKRLKYRD
ncbi:MAG TPA: IS1595 family transposase [Thermoanaerobaculia bacterium]|nr:IS1595 family transposase [Thermoanaerobaculia bacterium]